MCSSCPRLNMPKAVSRGFRDTAFGEGATFLLWLNAHGMQAPQARESRSVG